jgi:hypothetical protein
MVIRVFPRRTSLTPTDEYAFVGEPPMLRPEADEVHVSCTFTWDKPSQQVCQPPERNGYASQPSVDTMRQVLTEADGWHR